MRSVFICLSLVGCVEESVGGGPAAPADGSSGVVPPATTVRGEDGEDVASTTGDGTSGSSGGSSGGSSSGESGEPLDACPGDELFPTAAWPQGEPQDFGIDPDALSDAAMYAGEHDSRCLVVIRDGHLVFEDYFGETGVDTKVKSYSIAKSYTSTLVGQAIADGFVGGIEDPLDMYLPELAGTDATIWNLLTMTSGHYEGIIDDYVLLTFADDATQHALGNQQGDPAGAAWEYSNVGVQLLEPVLRRSTGMTVDAYAQEKLWGPLGIEAEWDRDGNGNVQTYQNVRASCRDHAKFGYLYLKRGCWDGERVVEEDWVETATTTSQDLNRGYGYLFWVMGQEPTLSSVSFEEIEGGIHPFTPEGTFAARGLGGQIVEIIPALDMVIVRSGVAPQDDPDLLTDPLALIDALLNGSDEDVTGAIVQRVLSGTSTD